MTDKQIIINTNKYFIELTDIGGGTIGYTVPFPEELLREIIKQNKQLARKTQEYEELKAYTQRQENQRETYYKEFLKLSQENKELKRKVELMMDCPDCKVDEYKKALEEIERICLEDVHIFADGTELRYDSLDDILDIINKLKGGNNV